MDALGTVLQIIIQYKKESRAKIIEAEMQFTKCSIFSYVNIGTSFMNSESLPTIMTFPLVFVVLAFSENGISVFTNKFYIRVNG